MNNQSNWYAVYTKPRTEKKVHLLLEKKGINSWCPLQKTQRQWSDRKKIVLEPLFKSYVFVRIAGAERLPVLQTDGVINFVHYVNKPAIIREEEINIIKSYLNEAGSLITTQSWESLEANIRVQIKHGIFMDNTGTIVKTGRRRVYVRLESLGQVMVVEFPAAHVVPV